MPPTDALGASTTSDLFEIGPAPSSSYPACSSPVLVSVTRTITTTLTIENDNYLITIAYEPTSTLECSEQLSATEPHTLNVVGIVLCTIFGAALLGISIYLYFYYLRYAKERHLRRQLAIKKRKLRLARREASRLAQEARPPSRRDSPDEKYSNHSPIEKSTGDLLDEKSAAEAHGNETNPEDPPSETSDDRSSDVSDAEPPAPANPT